LRKVRRISPSEDTISLRIEKTERQNDSSTFFLFMCAETFKGYYSCHTYAAILVRKLARSLHHRHLATRWSAKSNRFRQIPCPRFDANTHSDNIEVTVCDTRTGRCISLLTTSGDALFFVFLRIRIISPYAVQSWMPLEIRHSLWHRLKVTQATVHGVLAYSRSVRDDDGESGDSRLRSMRQREAARCSAIVERISSLCVKTKRIITITITITQEIIGYRAVPSALRRRKSPCAGWELIVARVFALESAGISGERKYAVCEAIELVAKMKLYQ